MPQIDSENCVKRRHFQQSADCVKRDLVAWLLRGGMGFDSKTDAIGNEVLFSQLRRRADLLILSNSLHALEIKGDADNLAKLPDQIADYCKTFDLVSVVTTQKHLARVRNLLPKSVGIIQIEGKHVTILRRPTINRQLDKSSLLMFFNKKMLGDLLQLNTGRLCVGELRQLAVKKKREVIREYAYTRLHEKYSRLFKWFLQDTDGGLIHVEDCMGLSAGVSAIPATE